MRHSEKEVYQTQSCQQQTSTSDSRHRPASRLKRLVPNCERRGGCRTLFSSPGSAGGRTAFCFSHACTPEIFTLSLHDALPISAVHSQAEPGNESARLLARRARSMFQCGTPKKKYTKHNPASSKLPPPIHATDPPAV